MAARVQVQAPETNQRKVEASPMDEQVAHETKVPGAIDRNPSGSADGNWVPLRFPQIYRDTAEIAVVTAQALLIFAARNLRTWQDAWFGLIARRVL